MLVPRRRLNRASSLDTSSAIDTGHFAVGEHNAALNLVHAKCHLVTRSRHGVYFGNCFFVLWWRAKNFIINVVKNNKNVENILDR